MKTRDGEVISDEEEDENILPCMLCQTSQRQKKTWRSVTMTTQDKAQEILMAKLRVGKHMAKT